MERRGKPRDSRPRGGQGIAWLALLLSFMSCAMSCLTLLLTWHDGRLLQSAQGIIHDYRVKESRRPSLKGPDPAASDPQPAAPDATPALPSDTPAATAAERPASSETAQAEPATDWDALCEKLYRAEGMIRNDDDHIQDFMEGLKGELESLKEKSTTAGSRWIGGAAEKFTSIRQMLSVDAPEAARQLHALSVDIQQKAHAIQRVTETLSNLKPRRRAAADEQGPAVPVADPAQAPADPAPRQDDQK